MHGILTLNLGFRRVSDWLTLVCLVLFFSDEDSSESKRVRFYVVFVLNKNENGKFTRLDISMCIQSV